jgi:ATP-dependent Clp protease ATP-binding subunit ClpA
VGGKSGARDLRNTIRRNVEDRIASAIVDHFSENLTGISVTADEENGIRLDVLS